jgi:hypothetical protein
MASTYQLYEASAVAPAAVFAVTKAATDYWVKDHSARKVLPVTCVLASTAPTDFLDPVFLAVACVPSHLAALSQLDA